ncbi:hypothetical protein CRE_31386 [Caenorhabditis remanei]|uniref:Uncharacterized protein n=1 Tax=Caenorhabditis remanei TaxID=31234 RepID=E3MYC0_CAERE|nr:hypothetical protein CRE_31386 [Caenorhabditis remanei]
MKNSSILHLIFVMEDSEAERLVVLSCLRPEEVPHFREIIKKYNSGEANVKIFAQKLVELLGPGRKKRLSYLKHVLRADDIPQFDSAILESLEHLNGGNHDGFWIFYFEFCFFSLKIFGKNSDFLFFKI